MTGQVTMYQNAGQIVDPAHPWAIETPTGSFVPSSTQSQGLMETISLCAANGWNLTIEGGQDYVNISGVLTYAILVSNVPVVFPPMRAFVARFNGVHFTTTAAVTGDCYTFDSLALCDVQFNGGEITGNPGPNCAVVRLNPLNPYPGNETTGIGSSQMKLPAITINSVSGSTPNGACLRLTPSSASGISGFRLQVGEVNVNQVSGAFGVLVDAAPSGGTFSDNEIDILTVHSFTGYGVSIGNGSAVGISKNIWRMQGTLEAGAYFLATYGNRDSFWLNIEGNGGSGNVGVIEVGDHNIFDGIIHGVATPYLYGPTKTATQYRCITS